MSAVGAADGGNRTTGQGRPTTRLVALAATSLSPSRSPRLPAARRSMVRGGPRKAGTPPQGGKTEPRWLHLISGQGPSRTTSIHTRSPQAQRMRPKRERTGGETPPGLPLTLIRFPESASDSPASREQGLLVLLSEPACSDDRRRKPPNRIPRAERVPALLPTQLRPVWSPAAQTPPAPAPRRPAPQDGPASRHLGLSAIPVSSAAQVRTATWQ